MSIIEQATKRLEELRRAGIEIPPIASDAATAATAASSEKGDVHRAGAVAAVVSLNGHELATDAPATADGVEPRAARVAEIDFARLAEQGYLTPNGPRGRLEDEIRLIKMQLVRGLKGTAANDGRANLIVVTSALPGEGKTFFAMNLAMSIAMGTDLHAVLVDADVLRPCVADRCGIAKSSGLLDLLVDPKLSVDDVMFATNVPKLSFIQAGTPDSRSAELLAGNAAERLLTDLAGRFADGVVIFDAPPLLAATEARQLAARAGQVIVVVEADRTDARLVGQAFAALTDCPRVSSVLNRCPGSAARTAYDYYGG